MRVLVLRGWSEGFKKRGGIPCSGEAADRYGGEPIIMGVPPAMRGTEGGEYTQLKRKSPFGNEITSMGDARLRLAMTDLTAADAAESQDSVQMEASWTDAEGNTYTVRCCAKLETVGTEHPTFGGVVTNHLLHGFTRVGTPLMPTEFAYAAFWGAGEVLKNGRCATRRGRSTAC